VKFEYFSWGSGENKRDFAEKSHFRRNEMVRGFACCQKPGRIYSKNMRFTATLPQRALPTVKNPYVFASKSALRRRTATHVFDDRQYHRQKWVKTCTFPQWD